MGGVVGHLAFVPNVNPSYSDLLPVLLSSGWVLTKMIHCHCRMVLPIAKESGSPVDYFKAKNAGVFLLNCIIINFGTSVAVAVSRH